ncbi:hypothetical protein BHE90_017579, partial [Fusarium euwallaceae]
DQELGLLDSIAFTRYPQALSLDATVGKSHLEVFADGCYPELVASIFALGQLDHYSAAPPVLVTVSLDLSELNLMRSLLSALEVSQTTPAATACLYFPRAQSKQTNTLKHNARPFLWLLAAIFPVSTTDIDSIAFLTIQSG